MEAWGWDSPWTSCGPGNTISSNGDNDNNRIACMGENHTLLFWLRLLLVLRNVIEDYYSISQSLLEWRNTIHGGEQKCVSVESVGEKRTGHATVSSSLSRRSYTQLFLCFSPTSTTEDIVVVCPTISSPGYTTRRRLYSSEKHIHVL